jgi:hypothetical protein
MRASLHSYGAAVDGQIDACDEAAFVGSQEQDCRGNLFGLSNPCRGRRWRSCTGPNRSASPRIGASRSGDAKKSMPNDAITPFILAVPQADLEDLNRRIDQTRWPDAETVDDWTQGAPLAKVKALADHCLR